MSLGSVSTSTLERKYIKRAMNECLLERDEEYELACAWTEDGDEKALHKLTTAYMRLVVSVASKFRHYNLPYADLVSEGNIGLMQAASRFEPERGVRFSTYASWWIRASIQDYVLRNWSIVRTGTTAAHKSLFFNLRRLRTLIKDTGSGALTPENRAYVAQALKVGEDDVDQMSARLSAVDRSLNAPYTEDGDGEWQDLLMDERPDPEKEVMQKRDSDRKHQWIDEALKTLKDREQMIIRQRHLGETNTTLEALGETLGVSKERVRQIEQQALIKLRKAVTEIVGDPKDAGLVLG